MHAKAPETPVEITPLLTAEELARYLNVTVPGLYKAVNSGRIPAPSYPLSRSPRWRLSEIDAALEASRSTPAQARVERRQKRIERQQSGDQP
jgi:excisionase family DNA binding protein